MPIRVKGRFLAVVLSASLLSGGCGLFAPVFGPVSQTVTSHVDQSPDTGYIRFSGIAKRHSILLDGSMVGSGSAYRRGGLLRVTPGTHEIEIRDQGAVVLREKVFVTTGSTSTVALP